MKLKDELPVKPKKVPKDKVRIVMTYTREVDVDWFRDDDEAFVGHTTEDLAKYLQETAKACGDSLETLCADWEMLDFRVPEGEVGFELDVEIIPPAQVQIV